MSHYELHRILGYSQSQRQERNSIRLTFQRRLQTLRQGFRQAPPQNAHQIGEGYIHHKQIRYQNVRIVEPRLESYQENPYQRVIPESVQIELPQGELGRSIRSPEEEHILIENNKLKEVLVKMETEERAKMDFFQVQIVDIRDKYTSEIQKLVNTANQNRGTMQQKFLKMKQQIPITLTKNAELQKINARLGDEVQEGESLMQRYETEIRDEYKAKIEQIQKIYQDSNEKIEIYEKRFNEDEFVQNTLKNEQILNGIEQNAKKAEDAAQILTDYNSLLEGKRQILQQLQENNQMKESEIEKIVGIEARMKAIMDNMNIDKDIIVGENRKMAEELMQVKTLLTGGMGQPSQT